MRASTPRIALIKERKLADLLPLQVLPFPSPWLATILEPLSHPERDRANAALTEFGEGSSSMPRSARI